MTVPRILGHRGLQRRLPLHLMQSAAMGGLPQDIDATALTSMAPRSAHRSRKNAVILREEHGNLASHRQVDYRDVE